MDAALLKGTAHMGRAEHRGSLTKRAVRPIVRGKFRDIVMSWHDQQRNRLVRWVASQIQSGRLNRQGPGGLAWDPKVFDRLKGVGVDQVIVLADSELQATKLVASPSILRVDLSSDCSPSVRPDTGTGESIVLSQEELTVEATSFSHRVALINAGQIVDFDRVVQLVDGDRFILIIDIIDREPTTASQWSTQRRRCLRRLGQFDVIASKPRYLPFMLATNGCQLRETIQQHDSNESLHFGPTPPAPNGRTTTRHPAEHSDLSRKEGKHRHLKSDVLQTDGLSEK